MAEEKAVLAVLVLEEVLVPPLVCCPVVVNPVVWLPCVVEVDAPPGPATAVELTDPLPTTWEVAEVALGVSAPACCCEPVPGPAGAAPWNSNELGVKAAASCGLESALREREKRDSGL